MGTFHENLIKSFENFKTKYIEPLQKGSGVFYDTEAEAEADIDNIDDESIVYTNDSSDVVPSALQVSYDNNNTGMTADNVQGAISELNTILIQLSYSLNSILNNKANKDWEFIKGIKNNDVYKLAGYNEYLIIIYDNYTILMTYNIPSFLEGRDISERFIGTSKTIDVFYKHSTNTWTITSSSSSTTPSIELFAR